MTSNSRADRIVALKCAAVMLLALLPICIYAQAAPDAPRTRKTEQVVAQPAPSPKPQLSHAPVRLKSVTVRKLSDEYLRKLAGPQFLEHAQEPLYIQVETEQPLGNLERNAAPVILVNGQRLTNTRAVGANKLVAFLPDAKSLKDVNSIAVVWLGDSRTKTPEPLTLRLADVVR